jgi:hypothetical protein
MGPAVCAAGIRRWEFFIKSSDTVLDKSHSRHIESVRWQYSGNAHGIIRGIGLVNCIYVNPETEQFWVIDFRIFDPEKDGKGKADHVKDMLNNIVFHKKLPFKTVLMDTWYATSMLMLLINDHNKIFYCPMRKIVWLNLRTQRMLTNHYVALNGAKLI